MAVKLYLGRDLQGRPHAYSYTHEENGARRICQYLVDRLDRQKELYAVIANPCYTGSFFELNPDMVLISELGMGVVEFKHYFGEVDCHDPNGAWRAGSTTMEAGRGFGNPHRQVQSYADQIRTELTHSKEKWMPGEPRELSMVKMHTTVCFTNPFVQLEKCRHEIQYQYAPGRILRPWEKFSVTTAAEIPNWAMDMRFEVCSEANWFRSYCLLPQEIERLAFDFFHARPWDEMETYVREVHEPFAYLALVDDARRTTLPPFRIDREEIWIGRNPSQCNVVIPQHYSLVSNRHARLIYANRRFFLEDLGSTNGSYFPGDPKRLAGMVELKPNQRILLGDFQPGEKVCSLELRVEKLVYERTTELIR